MNFLYNQTDKVVFDCHENERKGAIFFIRCQPRLGYSCTLFTCLYYVEFIGLLSYKTAINLSARLECALGNLLHLPYNS